MKTLKQALLNEFRRLVTDPASRGTETTEEFNGDGNSKTFTLSNYSLMFVSSVTVDGVSKKLITDFTIDFGGSDIYGTIIFVSAPGAGTNNVDVTYTYGENWIYDDQPHATANMPRISLMNIGGPNEESGGVGDQVVFLRPTFRAMPWVRTGKKYTIGSYSYTGAKLLDYLITEIEDAIHTIRANNTIGNLIDIKIAPPVFLGMEEDFKLKRAASSISTLYQKSYS